MLSKEELEEFNKNIYNSLIEAFDDLNDLNIGKAKARIKILLRQSEQMSVNIKMSKIEDSGNADMVKGYDRK